jgi:hypothetical protein
MKNKPFPQTRVHVEHLGGSRVRYHWKCGHTKEEELRIGPTKGPGARRLQKPMGHDMTAKLVIYWNHSGGVIVHICKKCHVLNVHGQIVEKPIDTLNHK